MIDPQAQALKWIKNMEGNQVQGWGWGRGPEVWGPGKNTREGGGQARQGNGDEGREARGQRAEGSGRRRQRAEGPSLN